MKQGRDVRFVLRPAIALRFAVLMALPIAMIPTAPVRAADIPPVVAWSFDIPDQGAVLMDLPSSWVEVSRDRKAGRVKFKPRDGVRAELSLSISWSPAPDPDFNGAPRLRDRVAGEASDFLDQAVESRYTIRELRGPKAGGYYWTLRERMPKKPAAAYVMRGMMGVGTAVLDFTLLSGQPDMPEIRQALKMIASARQAEPGA